MTLHRDLEGGRWAGRSLAEQLGNAGSGVGRAIRARAGGHPDRFAPALDRALELLDLTLADARWAGARRREIARAHEYGSTDESLEAYFMAFAMAARADR